jgi:transcriptional regulator with XRE-family HTH domain
MGAVTQIGGRPLVDSQGVEILERAGGAAGLGDLLRRLRNRWGISQEAMARHIGMNHNVYGYLERGLSPRPGMLTIARLARGHSVSVEVLIGSYLGAERMELPNAPSNETLPIPPVAIGGEYPDAMGACLATMREGAQLSRSRLANAARMQRTQVGAIETGGRLNVAVTTIVRFVLGIAPDVDVPAVVGLLARVFAGEIERAEFDVLVQNFPGLAPASSNPPRGPAERPSGEARRGWSA